MKAYRKEWEQYRWEWRIKLGPRLTPLVTEAIAKIFELRVNVEMVNQHRGTCNGWRITLPAIGCPLGMVLHELSHAYDRQKYNHSGHTGAFVNAQGIIFNHSRPRIKEVLLAAKARLAQEQIIASKVQARVLANASKAVTRKQELEALKATSSYKIAKAEAKIKRLESKAKRIENLLKSYRRSLVHLRRYESIKKQNQVPKIESIEVTR